MTLRILTRWLFAAAAVVAIGCDGEPVVVNPDADDDTTIVEERELEVERDMPAPQPGTGVNVDVDGDEGVDVNVNPGATNDAVPPSDSAPKQ